MFTHSESRQNLAVLLARAQREDVDIHRKDGRQPLHSARKGAGRELAAGCFRRADRLCPTAPDARLLRLIHHPLYSGAARPPEADFRTGMAK